MIFKSFELNKIDYKIKFFFFYGENQGHKNEMIEEKFKKKYPECNYRYDELEVLGNKENFFNNILSKSFFEEEKLIIINRATDKLKDIIEEIIEKEITDLILVLNSNTLEKKSKLRALFEKNKKTICVPFYDDNDQTLSSIVNTFFGEKKINISQQLVNLIISRSRGDRQNLNNELQKIEGFIKDKKKIDMLDILKLTNLAENYSVSELIDSCLSKNKRKTVRILNENNYSVEDCILIIRTFLIKSKRLISLCEKIKETKNIETTISNFKPPIFWKDKEIVKQQLKSWSYEGVEKLIYKILKRPSLGIEGLPAKLFKNIKKTYRTSPFLYESFIEAEALVKYQGYIKRQDEQVKKMKKQENQKIPHDFDYINTKSLSNESREKLHLVRPQTLGQAMRVSGVTPADISVLSVFVNSFE